MRPACLPSAPGSQPSSASNDRFSIITTTTVSKGASDPSGNPLRADVEVVDFDPSFPSLPAPSLSASSELHAARPATPATPNAAAPARNPRRVTSSIVCLPSRHPHG